MILSLYTFIQIVLGKVKSFRKERRGKERAISIEVFTRCRCYPTLAFLQIGHHWYLFKLFRKGKNAFRAENVSYWPDCEFTPLFVCKKRFFLFGRGHIKAPAWEHTMTENPPAHTGVHAVVAIKLIASVSSHMHGRCLMCLVWQYLSSGSDGMCRSTPLRNISFFPSCALINNHSNAPIDVINDARNHPLCCLPPRHRHHHPCRPCYCTLHWPWPSLL